MGPRGGDGENGKSRRAAPFHIELFPSPTTVKARSTCLTPTGEGHRFYQRTLGGFLLPSLKYLPETLLILSLSLKCWHQIHSAPWRGVSGS